MNQLRLFQNCFCQEWGIWKYMLSKQPTFTSYFFWQPIDPFKEPMLMLSQLSETGVQIIGTHLSRLMQGCSEPLDQWQLT